MKRFLLAAGLLIGLVSAAYAAIGTAGSSFPFIKGLGYQQFTSVSAVVTLGTTAPATGATAVPAGATYVILAPEGQAIRWLDADSAAASSATASATVGMPVAAGTTVSIQTNFVGFKIFPQAAGATVNVWYGK